MYVCMYVCMHVQPSILQTLKIIIIVLGLIIIATKNLVPAPLDSIISFIMRKPLLPSGTRGGVLIAMHIYLTVAWTMYGTPQGLASLAANVYLGQSCAAICPSLGAL